jgi:hypothetical protein
MVESRSIGISSSITRRNLLSVAVTSLTVPATPSSDTAVPGLDKIHNDPAVSRWREWNAAHRRRYELCIRQQKLETKLLAMVGSFPQLEVRIPGKDETIFVSTVAEINRLLPGPEMSGSRKQAKANLSARLRAWKTADAQIGYTLAYKAETEMVHTESKLAEALWCTPAQSMAGIIAKLHSVIETQDPGASLKEPPWPELRLVLADLLTMNANARAI